MRQSLSNGSSKPPAGGSTMLPPQQIWSHGKTLSRTNRNLQKMLRGTPNYTLRQVTSRSLTAMATTRLEIKNVMYTGRGKVDTAGLLMAVHMVTKRKIVNGKLSILQTNLCRAPVVLSSVLSAAGEENVSVLCAQELRLHVCQSSHWSLLSNSTNQKSRYFCCQRCISK